MNGARVSGPWLYIGAVMHLHYAATPFILTLSLFSFVWDYVPVRFFNARHLEASRALDVSAPNDVRRSCGPESTRSSSRARALNGAVDRASETSDASD